MQFCHSILPIIVLYKQKIDTADSINKLNSFLQRKGLYMDMFAYDNSPVALYNQDFSLGNLNIHYVHDPSNAGVSKAYNVGAAYAVQQSKSCILLLDQDTKFPENFLDTYEDAVEKNQGIEIFTPVLKTQYGNILSPCLYSRKRGYWVDKMNEGPLDVRKYSPVNSGMLIRLKAFFEVGGYNEKVRLDFADFQFIEKFQQKYDTFYVLNLVCEQNYSGYDTDLNKLKHRYAFFCEGARNCQRKSIMDNWWYLFSVVKRMLRLIVKTRNISFFGIFKEKYLFGK